ncbi:MAG: hypothetical protein RL260_1888 [Pseudomonadota bacterium]
MDNAPASFPVAGLLLAAGQGERFRAAGGEDKLTARLPDGTLVVLASLQRLQAALQRLDGGPVIAVVREGRDDLAALLRSQSWAQALKRNDWNVTKSAEDTGMQRANFQALMKKHEIRIRGTANDPASTGDS